MSVQGWTITWRPPIRVPTTFPSPRDAALQAQLSHVHPPGNFGSLQAFVLWQRRVYPLEKPVEKCSSGRLEVGVVGTVRDDQGQTANSAAELSLSLAKAHPRVLQPRACPKARRRSPTLAVSSCRNHRRRDSCDFRPPSEIRAEERKGEVVGPSRFAEEQTSIDEPADEFRDGGRGDEGLSDRLQIHSSVLSGHCDEHSLLRRSRNLEPIVEEREVEFM